MEDLLKVLKESGRLSIPELRDSLHMSEAMIYARLECYEKLGYVRRMTDTGGNCGGSCGSCKGCGTKRLPVKPSVYWVMGDKAQ